MKVAFRNSFAKDLKAIRNQDILAGLRELIETVERADKLLDVSEVKKLAGGGHYFRIRLNNYRVGVILERDTVIFVRCLDRKEIYRYFP